MRFVVGTMLAGVTPEVTRMNNRQLGEGNSAAIVAIVVLTLVGLLSFFVIFQRGGSVPKKVDIDIKPQTQQQ